ncbi:glycosyltransferase family 4 protein [Aridibaculum aurantiacum]|uniref:glycosyltransferase family 4 protein n=1 Tax=Aridibaculum aurantiacum TaxID=2810307 RepID=UPI001A97D197|nr:glycosyltransferase family 1 protein [Aridibaculum aurantiacum]
MKVVYFHRRNPYKYVSIEAYFENVRQHLPPGIKPIVAESKYYSNGFFKRLYNVFEAAFRQGEVNHITGDVHFLALMMQKRKTILTIHDIGFLDHPSPLVRKVLEIFWVKWPVKRSGIVTAVSETTRQAIIENTKCDPAKVVVVPTCIGNHFTRVKKQFNKEKPVILQIGTVANKNCIRMARALEGINCKLSIVGQPGVEYLDVLKECNIDFSVSSHLSDNEMFEKYVECDLLLFASTLEGFGMPIIEANTVGRVVVTSNISSMPEVANDAACLVDPYDVASIREGVLKVINDDSFRESLVEKGYKNALRYNVKVVAEQYVSLYKKVIQQ